MLSENAVGFRPNIYGCDKMIAESTIHLRAASSPRWEGIFVHRVPAAEKALSAMQVEWSGDIRKLAANCTPHSTWLIIYSHLYFMVASSPLIYQFQLMTFSPARDCTIAASICCWRLSWCIFGVYLYLYLTDVHVIGIAHHFQYHWVGATWLGLYQWRLMDFKVYRPTRGPTLHYERIWQKGNSISSITCQKASVF